MQRLSALALAAGFAAVLLGFAAVPAFEIVPLETVTPHRSYCSTEAGSRALDSSAHRILSAVPSKADFALATNLYYIDVASE